MNKRDNLHCLYRLMPFKKDIAGLIFNKDNVGDTPIALTYFITNKCNAECLHCFYWKELNKGSELNLEEIRKVVQGLNLKSVQLTGGEPTLRDDLVEICKTFSCKVVLITNGWMGSKIKDLAEKLLAEKVNFAVEISLDGFKESHDKIRRINLFDKAIEAVRVLREMKQEVSVLTTVSKINYGQMERFIEFVNSLGVFHRLQYVRSSDDIDIPFSSDFRPKESDLPSVQEMEELNKIMKEKSNAGSSKFLKKWMLENLEIVLEIHKHKKKVLECLAGTVDGVIYPNGDVSFCEFMKPFGNVQDYNYDFKSLWNSARANKLRSVVEDCFCTHSCNIDSAMRFDKDIMANL